VGRRLLEGEAQPVNIDLVFLVGKDPCFQRQGKLEASEQAEPLPMKEFDRFDVARNRPDVDELLSKAPRLIDGLRRQLRTDTTVAMGRMNDDRLEFRLLRFHEKTAETDDLAIPNGDPELPESRMGEVLIELDTWINAADGRIAVDVSVALRQSAP